MTRDQHHTACRGYQRDRRPWRPFQCKSCDAIDREKAHVKQVWEREIDRLIHQHGTGENP